MTAVTTSRPDRSTPFKEPAEKRGVVAVAPRPVASDALAGVDALLGLDAQTLRDLYEGARAPRIEDLEGDLRGRLLAIPFAGPLLGGLSGALARQSWFPWRGKSFRSVTVDRGEGINRIFFDENRWFRFDTFIGRSRAGDFDALQLDYDNADNPFFIRPIKDEVRELRPGLFLGQAYLLLAGKAHLALYFGLEAKGKVGDARL